MATSRTDPRVVAAVEAAMRAAYSKQGTVDRRGDFVWSEVYPQWAGKNGYAWCGGFMVWAYKQVGVDLMQCAWWFYTPYIVNFAKKHGFWRRSSGYGFQPLFDWNGDGVADHVGAANPDTASSLYRSIEGNTSSGSAGSQSNGGGVWERYRQRASIMGWVDMYAVLAWMIDTGRWDGKTTNTNTTTDGGFLMSLTDEQQKKLYDTTLAMSKRVRQLKDYETLGGPDGDAPTVSRKILDAVTDDKGVGCGSRARNVQDLVTGGGPRGDDPSLLRDIIDRLDRIEEKLA